jgi:hypothetical protein
VLEYLIEQDYVEQRLVRLDAAHGIDETEFAESVERSGSAADG